MTLPDIPYRDLSANRIPGGNAWENGCTKSEKTDAIQPTLPNARRILSAHPYFDGCFGWSEMDEDVMIMRPLPDLTAEGLSAPDPNGDYPQLFTDTFHTYLRDVLCAITGANFNAKDISAAVQNVAVQNTYNPIRNYLSSLEWDGEPRLNSWLHKTLAAEPSAMNGSMGERFLVAACRRAIFKRYKFDSMLVLEGEKGIRKSTACRVLFGDEYFLEGIGSIRDDRTVQLLAGRWGVEIPELKGFGNADAETQKEFLSKVADTYKRPYAIRPITVNRRCVFIATTNQSEYLLETGGDRRFWCVACGVTGATNIEWLTENRDQLWAEAYHKAQDFDFKTYMEEVEAAELAELQANRVLGDPWEGIIRTWSENAGSGVPDITPERIATDILGIPADRQDRGTATKIGIVMKELGWKKARRRSTSGRVYVYERA